MMKSTCITHPAKEPLIVVRQWQLEFCKGNVVAAALMSFFEYWHNLKLETQTKNQKLVEVANIHGETLEVDTSLYQWHTNEDLVSGIVHIAKSKNTLNKAIEFLRHSGVISIHKNPNPKFKFDKTRYFIFYPEICNDWLLQRKTENELSSVKNELSSVKNDDGRVKNDDGRVKNDDGRVKNDGTITETTDRDYKQRLQTENNNMVAAAENLQWIDEPKRTELAKLDHVTTEYTETWLEWVEADSFPKWMTNPAGWAISQIEAGQHPPKKEDPIPIPLPIPELPSPDLDPGQKILENLRQLMPQAKHLLTRASVAIQEGHYTLSVPSSDWEWLTNRLNDQLESGFAKAVGYEGLEFESLQVESFT